MRFRIILCDHEGAELADLSEKVEDVSTDEDGNIVITIRADEDSE